MDEFGGYFENLCYFETFWEASCAEKMVLHMVHWLLPRTSQDLSRPRMMWSKLTINNDDWKWMNADDADDDWKWMMMMSMTVTKTMATAMMPYGYSDIWMTHDR